MAKINQRLRLRMYARGSGKQAQPIGQTMRNASPGPVLKPHKAKAP